MPAAWPARPPVVCRSRARFAPVGEYADDYDDDGGGDAGAGDADDYVDDDEDECDND